MNTYTFGVNRFPGPIIQTKSQHWIHTKIKVVEGIVLCAIVSPIQPSFSWPNIYVYLSSSTLERWENDSDYVHFLKIIRSTDVKFNKVSNGNLTFSSWMPYNIWRLLCPKIIFWWTVNQEIILHRPLTVSTHVTIKHGSVLHAIKICRTAFVLNFTSI